MQKEENRYVAADRLCLGRPHALKIERVRSAIGLQPFESAFAWDASGNLVAARDGASGKVSLLSFEWALLRDGILLHNHPKATPFSAKDIGRAREYSVARMEVVTPNALYWIEPPQYGWDWIEDSIWEDELTKLASLQHKLASDYVQKIVSRAGLQAALCDIMNVFKMETGIRYAWVER